MRWGFRLIGARLLGPAPVADVWLPFEHGVFALYGLNGAGKSRLLYELADLLEGIPSSAAGGPETSYLVAEIAEVEEEDFRLMSETYFRDLRRFRSFDRQFRSDGPWLQAGRPWWHADVGEDLYESGQAWNSLDLFTDEMPVLVDEIVRQNRFALTPSPEGWRVTPAVLRQPGTQLSVWIDELLKLQEPIEAEMLSWAGSGEGDPPEFWCPDALRDAQPHMSNPFVCFSSVFDDMRDFEPEAMKTFALLARSSFVPFRLGFGDHFDWLSVPSSVEPVAAVIRDDRLSIDQLQATTRKWLLASIASEDAPLVDTDGNASDQLGQRMMDLDMLATNVYERLLLNAPMLIVHQGRLRGWFAGELAEWMASSTPTWRSNPTPQDFLPLSSLSEAQRRWALISIAVTLQMVDWEPFDEDGNRIPDWSGPRCLPILDAPRFMFLDEPDGALHATAQREAVSGLVELSEQVGLTAIVATHSREFLNDPGVKPLHVARDEAGSVVISMMDAPQRLRLEELGLEPADLLLLYRAVLVVEGSHDVTVINALIGDELDRLRVLIVPMRGGRLMASVVDSFLLAHLSDVPVIAALDNLRAQQVQGFWEELIASGPRVASQFDSIVSAFFSSRQKSEEQFLISYCRAAVELGQLNRFGVFGFSKADIPEYLPVESVVPGAVSWEDLRAQFHRQTKQKSFKPWLKARFGVRVTEKVLHDAASTMDVIPEDFTALLSRCNELRRHPG